MPNQLPIEVVNFIASTDAAGLEDLSEAIKVKRKILANQSFRELKVGDRVTFTDRGRPKYLVGAVGTVMEKRQTKVVVDLDEPRQRFFKNIVCPVDLLEFGGHDAE